MALVATGQYTDFPSSGDLSPSLQGWGPMQANWLISLVSSCIWPPIHVGVAETLTALVGRGGGGDLQFKGQGTSRQGAPGPTVWCLMQELPCLGAFLATSPQPKPERQVGQVGKETLLCLASWSLQWPHKTCFGKPHLT